MRRATYPLKLPLSIKRAAERLAKEDGVSLNQLMRIAVGLLLNRDDKGGDDGDAQTA